MDNIYSTLEIRLKSLSRGLATLRLTSLCSQLSMLHLNPVSSQLKAPVYFDFSQKETILVEKKTSRKRKRDGGVSVCLRNTRSKGQNKWWLEKDGLL